MHFNQIARQFTLQLKSETHCFGAKNSRFCAWLAPRAGWPWRAGPAPGPASVPSAHCGRAATATMGVKDGTHLASAWSFLPHSFYSSRLRHLFTSSWTFYLSTLWSCAPTVPMSLLMFSTQDPDLSAGFLFFDSVPQFLPCPAQCLFGTQRILHKCALKRIQ